MKRKVSNMQSYIKKGYLNNKGIAISGIMYLILFISLLLIVGTLKTLQNRKTIMDKLKSDTVNALQIKNYDNLIQVVEMLQNNNNELTNLISDLQTITSKVNLPVGSIYETTVESIKMDDNFFGTWELKNKIVVDSGWQDFSYTNSTYIGTTQSSYTSNKWLVKDDVLYIHVGVGATDVINISNEPEIARIPIKGNTSFNASATRVWNGAIGATGAYGGFSVKQETDYITIKIKPHLTTAGHNASWYSTNFAIPLDDGYEFTTDADTSSFEIKYVWERIS